MYVESNDPDGAKVYDMIVRQILQDLVLPPSIVDLKAYVNPDDVVFIIAIKMRKTSSHITLKEVSNISYDNVEDKTTININDENFLPNILKKLWFELGRGNVHQPSRYIIKLDGNLNIGDLVIDDPYKNLKRRVYDAIFRIVPEGFKIMKDISRDDIVAVVATDELIQDAWVEKAYEYMDELDRIKVY